MICIEEMERLKESVENNELQENDSYCDYDDFEYEYGHNYIDDEQRNFIRKANRFFEDNQIRYVATYGVEKVRIVKLREEEHWSDYEL